MQTYAALPPPAALPLTRTFPDAAARPRAAGTLKRAMGAVVDIVVLLGIVMCIPFAILAVGIPIALLAQLVLWIARLL